MESESVPEESNKKNIDVYIDRTRMGRRKRGQSVDRRHLLKSKKRSLSQKRVLKPSLNQPSSMKIEIIKTSLNNQRQDSKSEGKQDTLERNCSVPLYDVLRVNYDFPEDQTMSVKFADQETNKTRVIRYASYDYLTESKIPIIKCTICQTKMKVFLGETHMALWHKIPQKYSKFFLKPYEEKKQISIPPVPDSINIVIKQEQFDVEEMVKTEPTETEEVTEIEVDPIVIFERISTEKCPICKYKVNNIETHNKVCHSFALKCRMCFPKSNYFYVKDAARYHYSQHYNFNYANHPWIKRKKQFYLESVAEVPIRRSLSRKYETDYEHKVKQVENGIKAGRKFYSCQLCGYVVCYNGRRGHAKHCCGSWNLVEKNWKECKLGDVLPSLLCFFEDSKTDEEDTTSENRQIRLTMCKICNYLVLNLSQHKNICHTTAYQCEFCPRIFYDLRRSTKHLKKHKLENKKTVDESFQVISTQDMRYSRIRWRKFEFVNISLSRNEKSEEFCVICKYNVTDLAYHVLICHDIGYCCRYCPENETMYTKKDMKNHSLTVHNIMQSDIQQYIKDDNYKTISTAKVAVDKEKWLEMQQCVEKSIKLLSEPYENQIEPSSSS